MRSFLAPRWLVAHAFVLLVVVVCVSLGLWQLHRLEERRALNAMIEGRGALPVARIQTPFGGDDLRYRTVEVRGIYDPDREVLVTGRSLEGVPGHHVLTPLVTEGGWAVVVERGWVPFELNRPPVREAAPPEGVVRVVGLALPSEDDGSEPGARVLRRPDVAAIAAGLPWPAHPFYVRFQEQSPPQGGALPAPVPVPERTEGPHLAYAVQWFLFAATAVGVDVALVLRDRRRRRPGHPQPPAGQPRIRESR
jgi:surfeit locus 1 family protein